MNRIDLGRQLLAAASLVLLQALAVFAFAQAQDPPARVARLSVADGQVSVQPAGVQDWVAAEVNRPLTAGDNLWVDKNSRAELDIGSAVIRLGSGTGLSFLSLDDSRAQMRLIAGTAIINVRELLQSQSYEVDTPNVAVSLQRPGSYRIEVNEAGDMTVVKVADGRAAVEGGGRYYTVSQGQAATFAGTDRLKVTHGDRGPPDELDAWSMQRDEQYEDSQSRQYVAEDIPGTEDLDSYGEWQDTPDDGYVWTPTDVSEDWVPYSTGGWSWVAPWGWTWIDTEPWGFAPFHYGRWLWWHHRWSWVPGPRHRRPVYAPALVGWVGGGWHHGKGGRVAWFALGPRERYTPAYRVSPGYLQDINVWGGRPPGRHYINAAVPGAVIAVGLDAFRSGRLLSGREAHLAPAEIAYATTASVPPAIVPTRSSVLGPGSGRRAIHPSLALLDRPIVAGQAPRAAPVSFERQLPAIRANGGRPLAPRELARLRSATPRVFIRRQGGWRPGSARVSPAFRSPGHFAPPLIAPHPQMHAMPGPRFPAPAPRLPQLREPHRR